MIIAELTTAGWMGLLTYLGGIIFFFYAMWSMAGSRTDRAIREEEKRKRQQQKQQERIREKQQEKLKDEEKC